MDVTGLQVASADDRVRAEAAGLPMPSDALCFTAHDPQGQPLAYAVVLPGGTERRVRAVAAGDPADPAVAEAVVAAREMLFAALDEASA